MSKKFEVQALDCPKCGSPVDFAESSVCPSCKHTLVVQPPFTIWTVIAGIKKLITALFGEDTGTSTVMVAEEQEERQKPDNLPKVIYYTRSVPIGEDPYYCECAGGEKSYDWGGFAPSEVLELLEDEGLADQVQFWELQKLSTGDTDAAVVILDYECKVHPSYTRILEHCKEHHPNAKVIAIYLNSIARLITPKTSQFIELLLDGALDLGDTVTFLDPSDKSILWEYDDDMGRLVREAIDPEYAANMHERRTTTDARRQLA